ncbi:MAG: hypothetical protein AAF557_21850 [Pseudomonadota bacterium]
MRFNIHFRSISLFIILAVVFGFLKFFEFNDDKTETGAAAIRAMMFAFSRAGAALVVAIVVLTVLDQRDKLVLGMNVVMLLYILGAFAKVIA